MRYCLVVLLVCTGVIVKGQSDTNLALVATTSTSYVSPWENLDAIKNGTMPKTSADKAGGAYGNWNGEANYNQWNWVQYSWDKPYELASTDIYWWTDNGGILIPTAAYVQYWDGSAWITINNSETNLGVEANKVNSLVFPARITTDRLRVNFIGQNATGILEWWVNGSVAPACLSTPIVTRTKVNGASWSVNTLLTVNAGDDVVFSPEVEGGMWNWIGPNGFKATSREITFSDVDAMDVGTYVVSYTNACGVKTMRVHSISISGLEAGAAFSWPSYSPNISYNFRDEFPEIEEPSQILDDCPEVVETHSSQWWCFRKGPDVNPLLTNAAVPPMLSRLNKDFRYFRDDMGWPPDLRAKSGFKSAVYLYGSGLCTDDADNTALGGWQGAINYDGTSWPMILASYYPVYAFDPDFPNSDSAFQRGGIVHEGIHSLLADLPAVKQSAWFHEGGNVWLQQTADARRSGDFSAMGDLSGTDFIAPFMPIECYSGWLQDGSFGGPSAEGVNMFDGQTQLCTWRSYLGGHQYSSAFPTFLGEALGDGAVPWIWRNAATRVLAGIASGIGDTQTRRLITEYRAKQAVVDFAEWTDAILALLNAHMGQTIRAEWQPSWKNPEPWTATPYVQTTNIAGMLTPASRTLPGWSGSNQIPLVVEGDVVTLNFIPLGENMTCQLAYRSVNGTPIYSQYVTRGTVSLKLTEAPANNVVIAVITNTDYLYEGEGTRKAKFDYRLQPIEGIVSAADINTKWFNAAATNGRISTAAHVGIDWSKYCGHSFTATARIAEVERIISPNAFLMYPNPVNENSKLALEFQNVDNEETKVTVTSIQGHKVSEWITRDKNIVIDSKDLRKGFYVVTVRNRKTNTSQNLIVK